MDLLTLFSNLIENEELGGLHSTLKVPELIGDELWIWLKDGPTLEVTLEPMILNTVAFVFIPILSLFQTFNELGPVPHFTRLSD